MSARWGERCLAGGGGNEALSETGCGWVKGDVAVIGGEAARSIDMNK